MELCKRTHPSRWPRVTGTLQAPEICPGGGLGGTLQAQGHKSRGARRDSASAQRARSGTLQANIQETQVNPTNRL
jgi:hypothetical protein